LILGSRLNPQRVGVFGSMHPQSWSICQVGVIWGSVIDNERVDSIVGSVYVLGRAGLNRICRGVQGSLFR